MRPRGAGAAANTFADDESSERQQRHAAVATTPARPARSAHRGRRRPMSVKAACADVLRTSRRLLPMRRATCATPAFLELERPRARVRRDTRRRGLELSLAPGAIGCLLGPSGCGKTTVLRCIAGFEPSRAAHRARRRVVSRAGAHVPPERRRIGMVFQDYALFPHLDVRDNVAFGLARRRPMRRRASHAMLDAVGLARRRSAIRTSSRAASSSASRSRARSRRARGCCCSTSRSPISTSSCASACRSRCATS